MGDEAMTGDKILERYARAQTSGTKPTFVRDVFRHLLARLDSAEARAAAAERERDELRAAIAPFAELVPSSLYSEDGSEGEKYIFLLHDQSTVNQSGLTGADPARAMRARPPQPR